ncbi:GIY-YIG nuclease family protein [Paenibacillus agricola]
MSKEKRKELVLAYKEMKKPMGIYRLRNTANGKIFIGSSLNLEGRWNRHQFELNMNMERIADLQNDWKQFGEQQFVFEVLEQLEQRNEGYQDIPDELEKLEAKWIEQLQPFGEAGYNMKK